MKKLSLISCLLLLSLITSAQETYLKITYDKFSDRTSIVLWRMPLAQGAADALPSAHGTKHGELKLSLSYSHAGRIDVRPPDDSETAFVSLSSNVELGLARPPRLILLIDGTRHEIQTEWPSGDGVDGKTVNVLLTYDQLKQLSAAKTTEGRLGIVEFHLVKWHRDEIKRFISAIGV